MATIVGMAMLILLAVIPDNVHSGPRGRKESGKRRIGWRKKKKAASW